MDDPIWLGSNSCQEERADGERAGVKLNALLDARLALQGQPRRCLRRYSPTAAFSPRVFPVVLQLDWLNRLQWHQDTPGGYSKLQIPALLLRFLVRSSLRMEKFARHAWYSVMERAG